MATVRELVAFFLPGQTLDDTALETATSLAEGYRPSRLPTAQADEAVAAYAAWLLYQQLQAKQTEVAQLGVASEQLADRRVDYREPAAAGDVVDDPLGLYARWRRLARIGSLGGVTAGWRR